MSCVRVRTIGATARTAGQSRWIASASCGVSVSTLPEPKLIPPLAAVPGNTSRLFAPMLSIVRWIAADDPCPISVIAMTAAIPMTMPSVVSAARVLFLETAVIEMRISGRSIMA